MQSHEIIHFVTEGNDVCLAFPKHGIKSETTSVARRFFTLEK
jgi:hypothetical protein